MQISTHAPGGWVNPFASSKTTLSTLVYQSRATKPLTPQELHELALRAQARNNRESITGLMLYDNSRFFQWLEGPADSVERVMGAIREDTRHTDIEILSSRPIPERSFGDWAMKLATHIPPATGWQRDVIVPPDEIIEDLRKRPWAAPTLLLQLVPLSNAATSEGSDFAAHGTLHQATASVLKKIILSKIIPQMAREHDTGGGQAVPGAHARAAELADLLLGADDDAARELIAEIRGTDSAIAPLFATLFEPAARQLGDLWGEDFCTEFDVTLGLCRLQSALRLLTNSTALGLPDHSKRLAVLIAPEPGELHRLGAALDGTVLRAAGWTPHCEYPVDDRSLQDLVSTRWFDVLDLSLSLAFRRDHQTDVLAKTVADARRASCNPALVVVVGGRLFFEDSNAGAEVGANLASRTSLNLDRSLLKAVTVTPLSTPTVSGTAEVTTTP